MNITWMHVLAWADLPRFDAGGAEEVLRTLDGSLARIYGSGPAPVHATALTCLRSIPGASSQAIATHHYAVETDVSPGDEAEFNAWYEQEHLPGLAAVPGTVLARRYLRAQGSPSYIACYDLISPAVLEHPAWLAVRHTPWSSRVRPMFRNPRRTMFVRMQRP